MSSRVVATPDGPDRRPSVSWIWVAPFLLIPAYLGGRMLNGDVMAAGQTQSGLAPMVAGHMFEHTLDYVFVGLMAGGLYAVSVARRTKT